jgi:hypothetical protein
MPLQCGHGIEPLRKLCVFGRYSEIELKPAAGILTNREVHDSLVSGCSGFIPADRGLHFFFSSSRYSARVASD